MMTKINKFALLLLMFCFALNVSADSEAEYTKLVKTWKLSSNGIQEFNYSMELKLFTHAAMNSKYGESFIIYNPQYQTLKINKSYTKQKDGTIVKTPDNAFVEVLPKNAENAPAYNHLKEMVVVHTGLELGATIYLDYTITSKPGYLPELDIFEPIQHDSPIKEYRLITVTPHAMKLNYTLANSNVKPSVDERGEKRITTWTLRNVPQLPTSAFVNVSNGDLPYLAATTYAGVEDALQTLNKQMNLSSNSQLQKLATTIKGKKSEACQLQALVNYASQNFSSNPLTLEQTGYRFRPVSEVLSTVYGTEIEKANFLAALLNAGGFKAEVLAGYPVKAKKGFALKAINHLYVAVNGLQYVFAVNSLARPQQVIFAQSPVYKVADGSLLTPQASQNYQIKSNQTLNVKDGKWVILKEDKVGTDLLPYFTKGDITTENKQAIHAQNGYTTLVLNENAYGVSSLGYNHLNSARNVNFQLPRLVDESYSYTVNCPNNMQLRTPEGSKEIHNAAGDLVISVKKQGQKATVTRNLKLAKQLYRPSEYKALRNLLTAWSDVNGRTLLFSVQ